MANLKINTGDGEFEHQKMTADQRRFLRMRWLISQMEPEQVKKAESEGKIVAGSLAFVEDVVKTIGLIEEGKAQESELFSVQQDRLEDIFQWSTMQPALTVEQQKKVLEWLKRDGHTELAQSVEQKLLEDEKEKCDV